tara:strand:+ start:5288 stop:5602 length:315 start_codon:yes stop_codon:yes gene_type:complete
MKKFTVIIIALFFLTSCQSTKEAFSLKKKSSTDEFLVEKKNPLVLPPDYGELPLPQDSQIINDNEKENEEINIFANNNEEDLISPTDNNKKPTSIEKSILEKIE